jgi:HEAT repeat protein
MPKADPVADAMARLKALRAQTLTVAGLAEVEKALKSKANIVVARAADIIREVKVAQFNPALVGAFDRFMVDPSSTDKGCPAKTSIAKALYELEAREEKLFLTGIHHRQPEGVWGGSSDTAAELRGICALGLVRCNYRDVMTELAELLMDPEPTCRLMAARATAYSENDAGAPLLRMKVLAGDDNSDVTGECFSALLKLTPRKSVEFVARYLDDDDDDLKQNAILALGESRLPDALTMLKERFAAELTGEARKPLILAIALTRLPQAIDFLLEVIANERPSLGAATIDTMKIYHADANIRARVLEEVEERGEPELRAAFDRVFA